MAKLVEIIREIYESRMFMESLPLRGGVASVVRDTEIRNRALANTVVNFFKSSDSLTITQLVVIPCDESLRVLFNYMTPSAYQESIVLLSAAIHKELEELNQKQIKWQSLGLTDSENLASLKKLQNFLLQTHQIKNT